MKILILIIIILPIVLSEPCSISITDPGDNTIYDCHNNNTDSFFTSIYGLISNENLFNITFIFTGEINITVPTNSINIAPNNIIFDTISCDSFPDFGNYNFTILAENNNGSCEDTHQIGIRTNESCIVNITSPVENEIIICDTENWLNFTVSVQKNDIYEIIILINNIPIIQLQENIIGERQFNINNICSSLFDNINGSTSILIHVSPIIDVRCTNDVNVIIINNITAPTDAPTTVPTTVPTDSPTTVPTDTPTKPNHGSLIISIIFLITVILIFFLILCVMIVVIKLFKKEKCDDETEMESSSKECEEESEEESEESEESEECEESGIIEYQLDESDD